MGATHYGLQWGLPAAIAIGSDNFDKLLHGAALVDQHFAETPFGGKFTTDMCPSWTLELQHSGLPKLGNIELRPTPPTFA